MSSVVWNRPDDDLLPLFDRAVKDGLGCLFCGGPLSLPCIYHRFPIGGESVFLHPACAAEMATFLSADVKEILCGTNAHLGIQAAADPSKPKHPEVGDGRIR